MAKPKKGALKKQSKKIASAIAKLFKDEVIKQDLVDTGLLRDSFRVHITFSRKGDLEIFVSAVDYFQFIDGNPHNFDVSEEVFKSNKYKKLEEKLIDLMTEEFLLKLPDEFDTSDAVSYNFTFKGF
jgi:hypothetical protein